MRNLNEDMDEWERQKKLLSDDLHVFVTLENPKAMKNFVFKFNKPKEPIKVSELEKDDMQGIRVIFGGKTTVAMKDDYTAISRCSPEDEYNPLLGAEIAIGRLIKKMRSSHA